MRDRRAVARYGGLTGSPDRSGGTNREKGMARSDNTRVRRGMIQLAWRFLLFQKNSALAQWYRRRTEHAPKARKTMIVALARKLLIALWRLVRGAWPHTQRHWRNVSYGTSTAAKRCVWKSTWGAFDTATTFNKAETLVSKTVYVHMRASALLD
jgi:hypothetical protein